MQKIKNNIFKIIIKMNKADKTRCKINDNDLTKLLDPKHSIAENVSYIKSKGFKVSKDRVSMFLSSMRKNNNIEKTNNNTRNYNNDLEDAFEALNNNRLHIACTNQNSSTNKTLTRKEFNNTINKMLKDIKTTCVNEFDAFDTKKEELLNWAKHNFYKVADKDRTFEELMSGLRLHLSRIRQLSILGLKLEKAKNDQEFAAIENQMYKIIDSFNNTEKSTNARVKLHEYKLEWELEHNSPF